MEGYLEQVRTASIQRNYQLFADLLWIPTLSKPCSTSESIQGLLREPLSLPRKVSGFPLCDVVAEHAQVLVCLSIGDAIESSKHSILALQELFKVLTSETRQEVPLLKRLCSNVLYLAIWSDSLHNDTTIQKEEAARHLSRAFTIAITDRALLTASKKWAALHCANLLFRLYFRLGTVRLCHNIVRAIDTTAKGEFPPLNQFPKAEVVTYCYYRGRLAINQSDFKKAEEWFMQAAQLCPPQFPRQEREVMIYYVLVKMIHGHLPTLELLQRHQLQSQFYHLAMAVRTGDLSLFDQVLLANQSFYMQKELFLVIQLQLRNLILRSFFKRIYLIGLQKGYQQENRLNLKVVEVALRALGIPDCSVDEVECIAANLISNGFIKGYISHEKSLIVLSKKNAFPPPSSFLQTNKMS